MFTQNNLIIFTSSGKQHGAQIYIGVVIVETNPRLHYLLSKIGSTFNDVKILM
jgi:hypothetical protein